MTDQKKSKPQNFVMSTEAPRFTTRILATGSPNYVIFSFGVENPSKQSEAHIHTRIAMPIETLKQFTQMINKIDSDIQIKQTVGHLNYDQIPSDS